MSQRIYLSPPHMSGGEMRFIESAFEQNWIAPLGPNVEAFEADFASRLGMPHALSLSSGTAAIHLALRATGIGPGDLVAVSSFTFIASASPISHLGATPVLLDSERESWNLDPALLESAVGRHGTRLKAVIAVDLFGQCADYDAIVDICRRHGLLLIEDAAEALGATHRERPAGTLGDVGVFSFNGNKIITTSGGGMLVSRDAALVDRCRKLATQAREPARHYEHRELGYNYRMSNVLAGIGRAQLAVLDERVEARRCNFAFYQTALGGREGIRFMPEASWGRSNRWLTCVTFGGPLSGARDPVVDELEKRNIEARPLWKPLHLQPVFATTPTLVNGVSEDLFRRGVCLPSGSALTDADRRRIIEALDETLESLGGN